MKTGYTYILTNKNHTVLYIGATSNLIKRIYEHKDQLVKGFTKKYNVNKLIYYEECNDINDALQREKQIKKWNRDWKIQLIERFNPGWDDLYEDICL